MSTRRLARAEVSSRHVDLVRPPTGQVDLVRPSTNQLDLGRPSTSQVDLGGPPPPLPQKLRRPAAAAARCTTTTTTTGENNCTTCRPTCAPRTDVRNGGRRERCGRTQQDVPDARCQRHGAAGSHQDPNESRLPLPRRPQTPGPRRPQSPSPSRQRCVTRTYICYLSPPSPTPPPLPPTRLATPSLVRRVVERPPSPETPSLSPSPPPRFSSMAPPRPPPSPPVPHRPPRCPRKPPPGILKVPGVNCGRTSPRRRGRHVEFLDSLEDNDVEDNRRA